MLRGTKQQRAMNSKIGFRMTDVTSCKFDELFA